MSPQQKKHLEMLLKLGDELSAIRYLQSELNMSADDALVAVEKLKPTVTALPTDFVRSFLFKKTSAKESKLGSRVGFAFMIIGFIMLGFSGYTAFTKYQFIQTAIPITGKVIDHDTSYSTDDDGNSQVMYSPVFEYEYNGETYTHSSDVSSSSPDFEIGEEAEIYINPDAPGSALVNSFMERWFVVVLLGGMGSMFTGLGYMAFRLF